MADRRTTLTATALGMWLAMTTTCFAVEHADVETISPSVAPPKNPTADVKAAAREILQRTNAFRREQGRSTLERNGKLTKAAAQFAAFMAEHDKYGHTADDRTPAERAKSRGYRYCIVAENIAYQFSSRRFATEALAARFVEGWEQSPEHRKNMLDRDVIEIGVGVARSSKTGVYYGVQLFGRPRSAQIKFTIVNRTDANLEYTMGKRTAPLPPHTRVRITRCRPTRITFRSPEMQADDISSVRPKSGDVLMLQRTNGKIGLRSR